MYSCYLIKHGDEYMMWDTGLGPRRVRGAQATAGGPAGQIKVTPDQVKFVGISHFHGDHIGQANSSSRIDALIGSHRQLGPDEAKLGPDRHSIRSCLALDQGGGKVEPVPQDKDVFGDGTVIMLSTPGHTPGHHSLLVKLAQMGSVVLSGDFAHFSENYEGGGVPIFNFNRAQTLASIDRIKKIAANTKATVILQHDARDVGKAAGIPGIREIAKPKEQVSRRAAGRARGCQ